MIEAIQAIKFEGKNFRYSLRYMYWMHICMLVCVYMWPHLICTRVC